MFLEMEEVVKKPWGYYKVLYSTPYTKVKELVIYVGHRLSLQRHFFRDEYWVIVEGKADILNGGEHITISKGDSTRINKGTWHRIENPYSEKIKIIEIMLGEYLEEDDIERTADDYGRLN